MSTARDRWTKILEVLSAVGFVDVEELSDLLAVSSATVRRDLDHLAKQQLLARTRGGAVSNSASYDLPLRYNAERNVPQKAKIATMAAAKIAMGSVVGLTGGTTTTEVARALALRSDLHSTGASAGITVVTNAINIANELAVRPHIKLVVLGGVVRQQSFELTGHLAQLTLDAVSIDTAIIGGNAISLHAGLTCHNENEAAIAADIARNAQHVIAVVDSSKFGKQALAKISDVTDIDMIVTDRAADADIVQGFSDSGVDVLLA